jgi:hypothetical protein
VYKGKIVSEPGIIYCPYRKPSIFRRFIKWIKGKFKKRISVELFVMKVDEPSKYTGRTYSKELIRRELDSRPAAEPFLAHFGREAKYATLTGFDRDCPIFEQDLSTVVGTVDSFRFDGNRLLAKLTLNDYDTAECKTARRLLQSVPHEDLRLAPIGAGDVTDGKVGTDYKLISFDLKMV